jgi:hypothetical protein
MSKMIKCWGCRRRFAARNICWFMNLSICFIPFCRATCYPEAVKLRRKGLC